MMKKIIAGVMCMIGVVAFAQNKHKLFDKGELTTIPGMTQGNLYNYLNRSVVTGGGNNFAETRIFEFTSKQYVDLGSLRELRHPYEVENYRRNQKKSDRPIINGSNYDMPNSTSENAQKSYAHKKWSATTERMKQQNELKRETEKKVQREKRFRTYQDFVHSNEAMYCDGVVPFTDRDGGKHMVGAIVLGSTKLEHCEKLKRYLQQNKR